MTTLHVLQMYDSPKTNFTALNRLYAIDAYLRHHGTMDYTWYMRIRVTPAVELYHSLTLFSNSFDIQFVVRLGPPLVISGGWSGSPQGAERSECQKP